jgi:coenzyme F420-0:L-glutamate ligase/coenzyme F420-1:gamma-L-glutamate ligase
LRIEARALAGIPEVQAGDDLAVLIAPHVQPGDVVVIAQKVVSKAEGRVRPLAAVEPSSEALRLASKYGKDPRLVQVVLDESAAVIRASHGVLICETHHGFVCANAGVDMSNAPDAGAAVLLPEDPDASARRIRAALAAFPAGASTADASAARLGVIISDSFGRAWRLGVTDVAIGAAGIQVLDDWRGRRDAHGRELRATEVAVADQLGSAADLARRKDSQEPVVVIRGAERYLTEDDGPGAAAIRRPREIDLFR